MNETPETTQLDVNLPKPRTHKVLIGVLVAVLALGIIGIAAAAIANRTAQSQGDATASVMPANTMMWFSLNTHADQLPNFNAIADAWQDSKEAKQVAAALELAFTQAGLNWEEDVQPWLGDRVAVGLVDLGGPNPNADDNNPYSRNYRTPFFLAAAQTKDRAKSDAVLANLRKQLESNIKPNGFVATTVGDETYRGIPVVYLATEYPSSGTPAQPSDTLAYATVDDMVVATTSRAQLHQIIDAALDGRNLTTDENFKTVMSSLPDQSAGTFYMDYGRLMPAYFDMIMGLSTDIPIYPSCEFEAKGSNATPDADCVKQRQEEEQRRTEQQHKLDEQMQQMRDMLQAIGGVGMTMSYEPTGIRFDTALQYDPAQLPADQRQLYESALTPASGRMFASLPASALLAVDFNLKGGFLNKVMNPDLLAAQFASLGVTQADVTAKLDEFQKLLGVNLQSDVLDLMNGDAGLSIMLRDQQKSDAMSFSMPFEFALLLDSSDAGRLMSSFEKVLQGLSAVSGKGSVKTQSLSGLPYSVVMVDDKPVLTYGVVDGRFVIGTDSNTLLGIDNADQASLANDATFKQATGLLASDRLNTAYLNFQPLWNLIGTQVTGDSSTGAAAVLNYLGHFKWLSSGAEAPANGLSRGSLHIGVSK